MNDDFPIETLPIPPYKPHLFVFLMGPAWLLTMRIGTRERAEFLFGCKLVTPDQKEQCAGAIYVADESVGIPAEIFRSMEFFQKRDGAEALLFRYRPFENDFVWISPEWYEARKR